MDKLERKINELEEELCRKKEAVAQHLFTYISDKYGTDPLKKKHIRDVILDAFSDVYANWDRL